MNIERICKFPWIFKKAVAHNFYLDGEGAVAPKEFSQWEFRLLNFFEAPDSGNEVTKANNDSWRELKRQFIRKIYREMEVGAAGGKEMAQTIDQIYLRWWRKWKRFKRTWIITSVH